VLAVLGRQVPGELRAAALAHLHDPDQNRHFAAVYALALTAEPGRGSTELAQLLTAPSTTDRLLAAGSLVSIGDNGDPGTDRRAELHR